MPSVSRSTTAAYPSPLTQDSLLGVEACPIQLQNFHFLPGPPQQDHKIDQDQDQDHDSGQGDVEEVSPGEGSPQGEEFVFAGLEVRSFRESGIASEYEFNTDESDERDNWGQGEVSVLLLKELREEVASATGKGGLWVEEPAESLLHELHWEINTDAFHLSLALFVPQQQLKLSSQMCKILASVYILTFPMVSSVNQMPQCQPHK